MTKKTDVPNGFQELVDNDFNERAKAKRREREREKEKNSNFELFSYLEQENLRLDKNSLAYLDKFEILKNHSQGDAVCEQADSAIHLQFNIAKSKYYTKDSDFIKSLNEIFNNFFNS